MMQKDPEMGHPVIPPGTPERLIPILGVVFAAIALVLLIIAANAGGADAPVIFLASALLSLLLAMNMARVWRRGAPGGNQGKTPDSANPDAAAMFAEGSGIGAIISPKALTNADSLGSSTAGAGPYMLDPSSTVSGSSYTYVPNPNYFDASQRKYDKVVVKVISNPNSALQAVTTTPNSWMAGTQQQVAAAQSSNLSVKTSSPAVYSLFLTDRAGEIVPALGDSRVRQALNYATDRDSIATLLHGTPNEQIVPKDNNGYYTGGNIYSYDVSKAKQLLIEAGYPNGFSFDTIVLAFDPNTVQAGQALAAQYAKIGVTMNLVTASAFPDFAAKAGTNKYSADIEPWGAPTMYNVSLQLLLPTGVVNRRHNVDDELISLFNTAAAKPVEQADATWQELSHKLNEKAWYSPMATVGTPFISSQNINTLGDTNPNVFPNPLFF